MVVDASFHATVLLSPKRFEQWRYAFVGVSACRQGSIGGYAPLSSNALCTQNLALCAIAAHCTFGHAMCLGKLFRRNKLHICWHIKRLSYCKNTHFIADHSTKGQLFATDFYSIL